MIISEHKTKDFGFFKVDFREDDHTNLLIWKKKINLLIKLITIAQISLNLLI